MKTTSWGREQEPEPRTQLTAGTWRPWWWRSDAFVQILQMRGYWTRWSSEGAGGDYAAANAIRQPSRAHFNGVKSERSSNVLSWLWDMCVLLFPQAGDAGHWKCLVAIQGSPQFTDTKIVHSIQLSWWLILRLIDIPSLVYCRQTQPYGHMQRWNQKTC